MVRSNDGARLSVEASGDAVVLRAQLDSSDVAHPDRSSIGRLPHHDLAKFFRRRKTALRKNRIGEFLSFGGRLAARLARRVHGVLRLNSADDFRDGDAKFGQLIGLYPQPHRVLAGAEYLNIADARRAQNRIREIDVRIVRQELGVVSSMRRVQRDQHQRSGNGFSNRDSVISDIRREAARQPAFRGSAQESSRYSDRFFASKSTMRLVVEFAVALSEYM